MRIQQAIAATLLVAASTLDMTAGHAAAAASSAPQPGQRVVVIPCLGMPGPQVRPARFVLACGDGNSFLTGLNWAQWGPAVATGTGVNLINDCVPDCARGHFHPYPVTVTLNNPTPWQGHPGLRYYTRLRLTYTSVIPDQERRVVTFRINELGPGECPYALGCKPGE